MKNVLVVEDNDDRREIFQEWLTGKAQFFIVSTAIEAIEALRTNQWDVLFLDHDLGGDLTGYDVAKWLEKRPDRRPPKVLVHSLNVVGVGNILRALPGADVAPEFWHRDDVL